MDTINGCTVIQAASIEGLLTFGAEETAGAYSVMIGEGPPGSPAPALHEHPTTDEEFYVISPGNVEHEFVEVEES